MRFFRKAKRLKSLLNADVKNRRTPRTDQFGNTAISCANLLMK